MIDATALQKLLVDLEADNIERTRSSTDFDKFQEAICAFSNDIAGKNGPSYLMIGVDDKSGAPIGLEVTDKLLLSLSDIRTNGNVLPQPTLNVEKFSLDKGDVVVVEVYPSPLPPVRFKGKTFIRVGPRKAVASPNEEQILVDKRISSAKTFDALPALESKTEDLSVNLFDTFRAQAIDLETIEANQRPKALQLAALGFYNTKLNCLTNAGLILFGTNIRYYLPGAYVQYLHMEGETLESDVVEHLEISGDLYSVIKQIERIVNNIVKPKLEKISTFQEREIFDYPEWALREIIMNAIMHKNYESNTPVKIYVFSNRIEIINPGGLYGESTENNFPTQNSYRNPIIAGSMKTLGFVNKFGYGVIRAKKLLLDNQSPPLKIIFDQQSFAAIIYKRAV